MRMDDFKKDMDHVEYSFSSSDGLTLYGQMWRPLQKAKGVILLIHGLGEHSGRYTHVAKALADAGYITSAFDLRGHGRSEGLRGHSPSFDAFMEDISIFLSENESLIPAIPRFLYGHSLGSLLILNFVIRKEPQLNGLIATGPALRNELEKQKAKVALANVLSYIVPTLTMPTGLNVNQLSQDRAVIEAYVNDPLVHDRASLSMAKYSLQAIDWAFDHADAIHYPLLVMQGSNDHICYPSGTVDFVKNISGDVTLKFWDGFYHEVHNEPQWEEVMSYMISWLDKHLN